jgi:hypothetical protein
MGSAYSPVIHNTDLWMLIARAPLRYLLIKTHGLNIYADLPLSLKDQQRVPYKPKRLSMTRWQR